MVMYHGEHQIPAHYGSLTLRKGSLPNFYGWIFLAALNITFNLVQAYRTQ